jgi:hypothetical protein
MVQRPAGTDCSTEKARQRDGHHGWIVSFGGAEITRMRNPNYNMTRKKSASFQMVLVTLHKSLITLL